MSELKLIKGGKTDEPLVKLAETPERVDFTCWDCKRPCVMFPRAEPVPVQHAEPTCRTWESIVKKKDDLARFLIKCGVEIHVSKEEKS